MMEIDMIGLVLQGGGAKGGYHIGVWKALRELDIEIGAVTGTSVGALMVPSLHRINSNVLMMFGTIWILDWSLMTNQTYIINLSPRILT